MDMVEITLPVSRAVAERCRDPAERARLGAALSVALADSADELAIIEAARRAVASDEERKRGLRQAIERLRRSATEAGLTPDEVEAELAAWKRERSAARRR